MLKTATVVQALRRDLSPQVARFQKVQGCWTLNEGNRGMCVPIESRFRSVCMSCLLYAVFSILQFQYRDPQAKDRYPNDSIDSATIGEVLRLRLTGRFRRGVLN